VFGGFDFKNCRIQEYTIKVNEPPNPIDWENQFITNKYDLKVEWDIEFFKKYSFTNPKFITLGIQSSSGTELYRKDFTIDKDPEYVKLDKSVYEVSIETRDKPAKIVMYLFDEEKQWSDRYEKSI
jgi:hypothetical protein